MKPKKYKKKPIVVEAMEWKQTPEHYKYLFSWLEFLYSRSWNKLIIHKDDKVLIVNEGDYIIQTKDDVYVCKPDIFKKTYKDVEKKQSNKNYSQIIQEYEETHHAITGTKELIEFVKNMRCKMTKRIKIKYSTDAIIEILKGNSGIVEIPQLDLEINIDRGEDKIILQYDIEEIKPNNKPALWKETRYVWR